MEEVMRDRNGFVVEFEDGTLGEAVQGRKRADKLEEWLRSDA